MIPTGITINEKYFDMVPRPTKEERRLLKESIKVNGQREEIVINSDGIILDGHTRFEICLELGLEPKTKIKQFVNPEQEENYVVDANLARRQLTKFSKVEILYPQYKKIKKHSHDGYKARIFAERIGIKETTFHQGVWLLQNANYHILNQLRNGDIAISATYNKLHKREQPSVQHYLKSSAVLECPCCKGHFQKKDLRVIRR